MYKAIVTVNGQESVTVKGLTPAALGEKIGLAIPADVIEDYVDVVFEVNGPITRRLIEGAGPILVSVTPAEPTIAENVITIPTAVSVDYKVGNVIVTDPITLTAEKTEVIVVAVAKKGFKIPVSATKSWTFTYVPVSVTPVSVTPTEPTMTENVITIPTAVGVEYKVDGVVVTEPITLTAENTEVIVVASATDGYEIPSEATKSWTFTYLP